MKRLDGDTSFLLRSTLGACPSCSVWRPAFGSEDIVLGVVYRRSQRSVTMRCERCGLQWTMTWAKVHQAATRKAALFANAKGEGFRKLHGQFTELAAATEVGAENETRRGPVAAK